MVETRISPGETAQETGTADFQSNHGHECLLERGINTDLIGDQKQLSGPAEWADLRGGRGKLVGWSRGGDNGKC